MPRIGCLIVYDGEEDGLTNRVGKVIKKIQIIGEMNIPFKPLYDLWKVLNHYNQATIKHKQINNSIKPDANIMVCLQDELVFFLEYLEERNMVGI